MHAMLVTPNGLTLMAADTPNGMDYNPAITSRCHSAASPRTKASSAVTGTSWPTAVPSPCHLKAHRGVTPSGCVWTSSALHGWSILQERNRSNSGHAGQCSLERLVRLALDGAFVCPVPT